MHGGTVAIDLNVSGELVDVEVLLSPAEVTSEIITVLHERFPELG